MPLPTLVLKRDGRHEPFEADKISQALFAATEALGAPNAFLARELTDSALHFLAQEAGDPFPTAQIAELVEKVVRELGQPAVAQALVRRFTQPAAPQTRADKPPKSVTCTAPLDAAPSAVANMCLEAYTLQAVFGRDLAAAHEEGLISLRGLTDPAGLASVVLDGAAPTSEPGWRTAWRHVEQAAGRRLVIDAAERYLHHYGDDWLPALDQALALQRQEAIVNANAADLPRWAQDAGGGPLFPGEPGNPVGNTHDLWQLLDGLGSPRLRLDWHLQESHLTSPPDRKILLDILARQHAVPPAFIFDRPRQPIHLAEGLDRNHSGVLLEVGLNLPNFLRRPDIDGEAPRFLAKLPSLARMAVRAGAQKRKYLRQHAGDLGRGFLLDRACLAVTPLGLDAVVQALLQQSCARSPRSLDLAEQIVAILLDQLRADSRAANLDIVLDGPCSFPAVADGLTGSDPDAKPADQLHAAAALQRLALRGTAVIQVAKHVTPEQRVELLEQAWRDGGIVRLRFATLD